MKFTTAAVIGLTAISATVLPATNAQLTSILHNKYKKSNGEVDDVDVVGVGSFRKLSDSDGSMSIAMIETPTVSSIIYTDVSLHAKLLSNLSHCPSS